MARTVRLCARKREQMELVVGDLRTRDAFDVLELADVEAIRAARNAVRAAVPPVLVPGMDHTVTHAEEQVSQAWARAQRNAARVHGALGRAMGRQEHTGTPPILAVVADDDLPWELYAEPDQASAMEAREAGIVVRLAHGQRWDVLPPGTRVRLWVWVPDATDPIVGAHLALVEALGASLGVEVVQVDPLVSDLPLAEPDVADVGVMICHGAVLDDRVRLWLSDGELGGGRMVDGLARARRQVRLWVLQVCEGGRVSHTSPDTPARRLLSCGFPAVVAPGSQVAVEAAAAFLEGLLQAMQKGLAVADAVAAGRHAVRLLAHPHPTCRWHNLRLFVSDVAAAEAPVVDTSWAAPGWPAPDRGLQVVLAAAEAAARTRHHRWVGIEHLVLACHSLTNKPGMSLSFVDTRLVQALAPYAPVALRRLARLSLRKALGDEDIQLSPRLQRMGAAMPRGCGLRDLIMLLSEAPDRPMLHLLGLDLSAVLHQVGSLDSSDPSLSLEWVGLSHHVPPGGVPAATRLRVLGGPQDGLDIHHACTVGRWSSKNTRETAHHVPIYRPDGVRDQRLHRVHFEFGPEHGVRPLSQPSGRTTRGVQRTRRAHRSELPVDRWSTLQEGDLVEATDTTWFMALGPAERHNPG